MGAVQMQTLENNLPLVTIVASSLESVHYLPEMIESVLAQDYSRFELFIQDGGSQDGTLDVLQRYPVRWASEPDTGISQALNRAIQAARGEIIGFIYSDDRLQPGAVTAVVEAFRARPETVMVYGDCYLTRDDRRPYKLWKSRPFDLDQLFWENFIPNQTVYVRREALLEVGGFDETMRQSMDHDLWIRLATHYSADAFQYVPNCLGSYWIRFNSVGMTDFREMAKCLQRTSERFFANPLAVAKLKKGKDRAYTGVLLMRAGYYALAGEKSLAWKLYQQAIKSNPTMIFTKFGIGPLLRILMKPRVWRFLKKLQRMNALSPGE
jgi:glycosyltransferase involved in cell wall biosynthesis